MEIYTNTISLKHDYRELKTGEKLCMTIEISEIIYRCRLWLSPYDDMR